MTIQMNDFYFKRSLHHTKDTRSPTISRLMPIGCWNIGNNPASWNSRIPMFKHIMIIDFSPHFFGFPWKKFFEDVEYIFNQKPDVVLVPKMSMIHWSQVFGQLLCMKEMYLGSVQAHFQPGQFDAYWLESWHPPGPKKGRCDYVCIELITIYFQNMTTTIQDLS